MRRDQSLLCSKLNPRLGRGGGRRRRRPTRAEPRGWEPQPPLRRAGCAPPTHATSPRVPAAPCAVHCRRRRRRMRHDAQHLEDLPPRIAARADDSQGERGVDRNGGHGRVPDRRGSEDAPRERQAEGALRGRERIPPLYAVALRCPCCAMSCRCQKFNWSRNRTWVVRGGAGLVT